MAFSQFKLENFKVYTGELNDKGQLCNMYTPLQNLAAEETHILGDFSTANLNFDMLHPVDIVVQDADDGAVNLILNDGKNIPRLINTRFSVQDENTFNIPDHTGFKDTNIYEDSTFDVDTALKAIPIQIPKVEYLGLQANAGNMKAGVYTFFFKLCDADGNETEIIAESGIVQCHIGNVCTQPKEGIRMGMQDENTSKAICFKLTHIDAGFDFIHVYYARQSSGQDQASTWVYTKIVFDYPVNNQGECEITITGNYPEFGVSKEEVITDYADIQSVKTQAVCSKLLLFGNVNKIEHDWDEIKRFTWKIIPREVSIASIGTLNTNYLETNSTDSDTDQENFKQCYYNTRNVYYRLGYWPDEIYRFGIVYVFEDNSLSPVINLQGINFDLAADKSGYEYVELFFEPVTAAGVETCPNWLYETDDGWFRKDFGTNAYGVTKFSYDRDVIKFSAGAMRPRPLGISFDFTYIGYENAPTASNNVTGESWWKVLQKHKIKGYFFVRQQRVPTILGQGIVIGHTGKDYGSLPVLSVGSEYSYQSFLSSGLLLSDPTDQVVSSVEPSDQQKLFDEDYWNTHDGSIDTNAMLFPDAEMMEATYNQIFTSAEFAVDAIALCKLNGPRSYHSFDVSSYKKQTDSYKPSLIKLTNVPEDMKLLTNGTDYFSTLAGNPDEPFKTSNVGEAWKFTKPQDLTDSRYLVRGKWGAYVGTSKHAFPYGTIVNVKLDKYGNNKSEPWREDFEQLMFRDSPFFPISDRTPLKQWQDNTTTKNFRWNKVAKLTCARGDCFISMFTHRMFRNFIDPELPTNTEIIDPTCFCENYAVRCTTQIAASATSNLAKEHEGWSIPDDKNAKAFQTVVYFLTGNILGGLMSAIKSGENPDPEDSECKKWETHGPWAHEIVQSFEVYNKREVKNWQNVLTPLSTLVDCIYNKMYSGTKRKLKPKQQETKKGFSIKALFTPDDMWELHGLASINRADVNAVGLGQWITFPILSNKNLAFRDVDFSNATEEASFNQKRSFYPCHSKDVHLPLRDSNVINQATGISLPAREYTLLQKVPYIKQEFFTRIMNSKQESADNHTNEFKVMLEKAFCDYTKVHGSITKLMSAGNNLYVIFKHGIGVLNIGAGIARGSSGENQQEPDSTLFLPENIDIISNDFGSIWKDSIIETPNGIYGVDSVAKIIWRIRGTSVEPISTFVASQRSSVQKYLNDTLDMSEFEFRPFIGHINIKTHYNAFKHDVMFTYYNDLLYAFAPMKDNAGIKDYYVEIDGETAKAYYKDFDGSSHRYGDVTPVRLLPAYDTNKQAWQSYEDVINEHEANGEIVRWAKGTNWSLCYNEDLQCFQTFYDWIPLESANIGNVFFSFDRDAINDINTNVSQFLLTPHQLGYQCKRLQQHKNVAIDKTFSNQAYIYVCDRTNPEIISIGGQPRELSVNTKIQLASSSDALNFIVPTDTTVYYTISFYAKIKDKREQWSDESYGKVTLLETKGNSIPSLNKEFKLSDNWQFYYTTYKIENSSTENQLFANLELTLNFSAATFYLTEVKFQPCSSADYETFASRGKNMNCVTQESGFYPLETYNVRNSMTSFYLWKHGQAGVYDNQGELLPTNWYGKQHEFNFEFVVNDKGSTQKIFNNLQLISNKAPMMKIEYELPGESYDWHKYKDIVYWLNKAVEKEIFGVSCTLQDAYKDILRHTYQELIDDTRYDDCPLKENEYLFNKQTHRLSRLPFLPIVLADRKGLPEKSHGYTSNSYWENLIKSEKRQNENNDYLWNTSDAILVYDDLLNEYRIHTEQYCNDMAKYGRIRGNIHYLEDAWRIETRPIPIRYCSYDLDNNELKFERLKETRHRDKYIKIKIRYSGEDLAIIQAVSTLFSISNA